MDFSTIFRQPLIPERLAQANRARRDMLDRWFGRPTAAEIQARVDQERQAAYQQMLQGQAQGQYQQALQQWTVQAGVAVGLRYQMYGGGGAVGGAVGGAGVGGNGGAGVALGAGGGGGGGYARPNHNVPPDYDAIADNARPRAWDGNPHLKRGARQHAQMNSHITFESRDEQGRFHNDKGPALILGNSPLHTYYYWHGLEAQRDAIIHPERITLDYIDGAMNIETRRVWIERYKAYQQSDRLDGYKLYMQDCSPTVIDHDERFGTLVKRPSLVDETIAMVVVTNRTMEKDGSFTKYYLRVPPAMQTARQAVAWTFGLEPDIYDPIIES